MGGLTQDHRQPRPALKWENSGDAARLDDGMMIGPGGFEAVSKLFYRLGARAIPHQETYERCRQTAYHPDQILHACPFFQRSTIRASVVRGWMQEASIGYSSVEKAW